MELQSLLSVGTISQILDGSKPANPVLQIIGYKPMTPDQIAFGDNANGELRYRLMVGDGIKAHQYCVITNQDLVNDIKNGRLEKWSVIRVTNYQTVEYGDGPPETKRTLVYILNLEVVKRGSEVNGKISVPSIDLNNQKQPRQMPSHPLSHNSTHETNPPAPRRDEYSRPQPLQYSNYNEPTQPKPYTGLPPDSVKSPLAVRSVYEHQCIGIAELTPYIGKWVVKGRVTSKSGIREYNNAKGGGKLFNFMLADKTGEIKVTAFNVDCERVFPMVEPSKVLMLGRATVKNADKRYTTADFEITLNNDSLLEEVTDTRDTQDIPLARFNFVSIGTLSSVMPSQPIDLFGAITHVSDVSTIVSRTKNKELKKRDIVIVDMSRHSISITLWGEQAETFMGMEGDVFATKAARIGTYGGRSGSAGDCIFVNPDIPEVRKVKSWYNNLLERNFTALTSGQEGGQSDQWRTLDQMLSIEQAKAIVSSGNQAAAYGKCKAMLMAVGKNPIYKCCPTDGCGKKLIDTQNGELKCEKCQQTYTNYKYRYMTKVEIGDMTNSCWTTLWDEKAEMIFQKKPEDLERLMKMDNKDDYEKVLARNNFKSYIFTFRVKLDTYNNEERVQLNVLSMVPLEYAAYSRRLIEEIKALGAS